MVHCRLKSWGTEHSEEKSPPWSCNQMICLGFNTVKPFFFLWFSFACIVNSSSFLSFFPTLFGWLYNFLEQLNCISSGDPVLDYQSGIQGYKAQKVKYHPAVLCWMHVLQCFCHSPILKNGDDTLLVDWFSEGQGKSSSTTTVRGIHQEQSQAGEITKCPQVHQQQDGPQGSHCYSLYILVEGLSAPEKKYNE